MKRSTLWLLVFSQILLCSCIYDSPRGDKFYRTLWTSEDSPLGAVTLEFLCGGNISIKGDKAVGSYGTYQTDGQTAYFSSLKLQYSPEKFADYGQEALNSISKDHVSMVTIIIEDGYRTDETLSITWHFDESDTSYSTTMTRRSSYE